MLFETPLALLRTADWRVTTGEALVLEPALAREASHFKTPLIFFALASSAIRLVAVDEASCSGGSVVELATGGGGLFENIQL